MLQKKINSLLLADKLKHNDKKIGKFIIDNYENNLQVLSLKELACKCEVSNAAITRFFNKINIPGYKGFINIISSENTNENPILLSNEIQSIINTKRVINEPGVNLLADLILKSNYVKLYACGFSEYYAMKLKRLLNKINIKTTIVDSYDVANIFPSQNEVHIFISLSGDNRNFTKIISKLQSFNEPLKIFSITSSEHSTIKKACNEHIHGSVYTDGTILYEKELPTISGLVMHTILDHIFQVIFSRNKKTFNSLVDEIRK